MTEARSQPATAMADDLFDKYTLPKVALMIILAASLVGTAVSVRLTGWWAPGITLVKWSYFVALGVLVGGLVWKHGFVRPQDLETGAEGYCASMYDRFNRIAFVATLVVTAGAVATLTGYYRAFGSDPLVMSLGLLLATAVGATTVARRNSKGVEATFRHPVGLLATGSALAAVGVTAVLEASLGGADLVAMGIRILHLLTFALWIGGAVWNIFVAVPTGQEQPTVDVVQAAGEQLERFRWAVRFIIPTLLVTGVYQAIDVFGLAADLYLGTPVGIAILAKVGFVGLLFVIFKLCPMWRACSPIDGVCDLDELAFDSDAEHAEAPADD
jgi:uncharacterized membrane protein